MNTSSALLCLPATEVLQHLDAVILLLDVDGRIAWVSPAAKRHASFAMPGLIGRSLLEVLDPWSQNKALLMLERTLSEGSVRDWELNHLRAGYAPVLIAYTTSLLHDPAGTAVGLVALGRDLSDTLDLTAPLAATNQALEGALLKLERAHTELKATQAQLVQSEKMRALGQLVAGVAHEINNPAAFVANNLAHCARLFPLLRSLFVTYAPLKAHAAAEQRRFIEQAEEAAEIAYLWDDLDDLARESQEGMDRIRNIVLSLRNFARLDEADLKEADVNEGLRNTVPIVRPLCKGRVTLEEHYAALPSLLCHPGELNQVFLNMLTNAIQAIEGPGHITITTEATSTHIVVTISDTGSGMDEATLQRLGEPFFTTKPVGTGTGLGLAISFGIVERHRGRLRYESQPGAGTRAILELRLQHD